MATKLAEHYDLEQGALTVLVEDCQDPNDPEHKLKSFLSKLYAEGELLYLDESAIGGQELFRKISREIDMGAVKMPQPGRIVLSYYVRLNELNAKWTNRFLERAKELQELAAPTQIEHIVVFYYEQVDKLGEAKEDIISQLLRLGDTSGDIVERKIYLLWRAGFATLDSQEQGLAQLLHIRSRKRQPKATTSSTYGIRSICYADYYEDRANQCKQIIDSSEHWINEEEDPGFEKLFSAVKTVIDHVNAQMEDAERSFRNIVSLFPLSVRDYKKGFLGMSYQRDIGNDDPRIRKKKEEFLKGTRDRLIQEADVNGVLEFARKNLNYPDLKKLAEKLPGDTFEERMRNESYAAGAQPKQEIVHGIIERVRAALMPYVNERDMHREEKILDTRMARREQAQIGNYNSLQEFTSNIMDHLLPASIKEFIPVIRDSYVLVSGNCKNEIELGSLSVKGTMEAYYYPVINPSEIAVLRECDFLVFDDTDAAANKLRRMFGD